MHICAGRAKVGGGSLPFTQASKKLRFNADGKILVFQHASGRLAMKHGTAVANGPPRAADSLLSNKPVFNAKQVMGKFFCDKRCDQIYS